jgi:hypothetical protein
MADSTENSISLVAHDKKKKKWYFLKFKRNGDIVLSCAVSKDTESKTNDSGIEKG